MGIGEGVGYWVGMTGGEVNVQTMGLTPAFSTPASPAGPLLIPAMQQTPPTPESEEMMGRMAGNFDLFVAHGIRSIIGYAPDVDALRKV